MLRAAALLLVALPLSGCVTPLAWEAARVLADVNAGGGASALKAATPLPLREPRIFQVADRRHVGDLYTPGQGAVGRLVMVPGFTRDGKDDARLVELATTFARARFQVLVPDLAASRALRVHLDDTHGIADAAVHLAGLQLAGWQGAPPAPGVGVVAISYAAGLAVLASQAPDAKAVIRYIVAIGGYHDTTALARFIATANRQDGQRAAGDGQLDPAAKAMFLASNAAWLDDAQDRVTLTALADRRIDHPGADISDLAARLGPQGSALLSLLDNSDPAAVEALIARQAPGVRDFLQRLSLAGRDLAHLTGRLILIHGREDRVTPASESQALAAAVPGTQLFLIDGFSHIDPRDVGLVGQWQLLGAVQEVLRRRGD